MMRTATAPPTLVLRVVFTSGSIREERGTLEQVNELFSRDAIEPPRLVDQCLTWDPATGNQEIYLHADDPRLL